MRPTISLACILKNEFENLPIMLESVRNCFDEIHLTDTGSTDGSIELIRSYELTPNPANSKVFLHHFDWVDDFAAARNSAFSHVKTDYVMWMDLDDVLSDRKKFIEWRDSVMKLCDFWVGTYNYAFAQGVPVCSFARERVVSVKHQFKWNYFIHEGMACISEAGLPIRTQYINPWTIDHRRTADDAAKDQSRNISIIEKHIASGKALEPRMMYYYGKELFENKRNEEAMKWLLEAISQEKLEMHDRVMGIQYACFGAMILEKTDKAIQLAHQGLQLDPGRAEFYVIIGDCYLKQKAYGRCVPFYMAATSCPKPDEAQVKQAIYQNKDVYGHYPLNQLARVYFQAGQIDKAYDCTSRSLALGMNDETQGIRKELETIKNNVYAPRINLVDHDAVVFTGLPNVPFEWDEDIYKQKGVGGSETACIEMARHISNILNKDVLVFNNRKDTKSFGRVKYMSTDQVGSYFKNYKPLVNIAWRHNIKMTDAPTYVWSHDLGVNDIQKTENYKKLMCLSSFHKDFVKGLFGINDDKIWITRNGIDPSRFENLDYTKERGKIVYSSSPDRGLDKAIEVMDRVITSIPEAKLHVFYGFHNMERLGMDKEVKRLKDLLESRPYVVIRGNVEQRQLVKELCSAQVWLYPTNFLETFCITALEMALCKVYPVVRGNWGALEGTIKSANAHYSAVYEEKYPTNEATYELYAAYVVQAIQEEKYNQISVNPESLSWKSVAQEWIDYMGLK